MIKFPAIVLQQILMVYLGHSVCLHCKLNYTFKTYIASTNGRISEITSVKSISVSIVYSVVKYFFLF